MKFINSSGKHSNGDGVIERQSFTWIYPFVDIIYAATIYVIGLVFENCGDHPKVFLMVATLLIIMFSTRNHFDVYSHTFGVSKHGEIPRILTFLFYCLCIYQMAENIVYLQTNDNSATPYNQVGDCVTRKIYDRGFGGAYFASRFGIIGLYIYQYYFHVVEESTTEEENTPTQADYRNLVIKKVVPLLVCCSVMFSIFFTRASVIVFPFVAFLEIVGDFAGDYFIDLPLSLRPEAHEYQEQLGLMFMLILGEEE